jgi:hypothetical protein
VFTNRIEKIAEIRKASEERQIFIIIKHLMHHLSEEGKYYIVYFDNFFTTGELLTDLKYENINTCGTVKADSGISKFFVNLRITFSK